MTVIYYPHAWYTYVKDLAAAFDQLENDRKKLVGSHRKPPAKPAVLQLIISPGANIESLVPFRTI